MTDDEGVPAGELSEAELERQGVQAHATRHWIFLHGTAEQFRTHTRRMLELEAHQVARSIAPNSRLVAELYKANPPLLRAEGDSRVLTDAGRAWPPDHALVSGGLSCCRPR